MWTLWLEFCSELSHVWFCASNILDPAFILLDGCCLPFPNTPQLTSLPHCHPTSVYNFPTPSLPYLPSTLLGVYNRIPLRGSLAIGDIGHWTDPVAFSDGPWRGGQPRPLPISPPHFLLLAARHVDSYAGLPHIHLFPVALATRLRKLGCQVSKVTQYSDNCYMLYLHTDLQLVQWEVIIVYRYIQVNIESGSDHKIPFHLYNKLRIKLETFYNKKKLLFSFSPGVREVGS